MDSTYSRDNSLVPGIPYTSASRPPSIHTIQSDAGSAPQNGRNDSSSSSAPSFVEGVKFRETRPLNAWDVAALIINKMIGSGIFTGPPTILMYTGRKSTAVGMWVGGFVYTLISMTLYLEFSRKLPYTGGELAYLDAILPRPALFTYTCYALYMVCMVTTATSSMQFARQVLIAATDSTDIHDERVMRFIAVVITSVICLLLYFSTAESRKLNRWLAGLKLSLMLVVLVAICVKAGRNSVIDVMEQRRKSNSATGMLQVLFAFQGWENAIYVSGQIPNRPTLRRGFLFAVWIVGLFYIFINVAYCYAFTWDEINSNQLYVPELFGTKSQRTRQAWAVLTALSSAGSMLGITYTSSIVKQAIAWTNILPWSYYWRTHAPMRTEEPSNGIEMQRLLAQNRDGDGGDAPILRKGTPQGGIALHWIACVFYIAVSSVIKKPLTGGNFPDSVVGEGINLSGFLQIYAHAIGGIFIGIFFFKLKYFKFDVHKDRGWSQGELPRWLKPRPCQYLLGWIYASSSLAIIILAAVGPYVDANGKNSVIKGWYYPTITFGFLGFSIIYYLVFFASVNNTWLRLASVRLARKEHGVDDNDSRDRKCEFCAKYGSGRAHRHTEYGYLQYFELKFDENKDRNFLYWFFGGPKESHRPSFRLLEIIVEMIAMVIQRTSRFFIDAWEKMRHLRAGSGREANT